MKILFAFDGSEHARAASELLVRLPLPAGSEITVMSVAEPPSRLWQTMEGDAEKALERVSRELAGEALARARRGADPLRRDGVAVHLASGVGDVTELLVGRAREDRVDLLVAGARGLGPIERLLLGSVAGHLLAEAPCSLLLVRPPAESSESSERLRLLFGFDGSDSSREAQRFLQGWLWEGRADVDVVTVLILLSAYGSSVLQKLSETWRREKDAARAALEAAVAELRQAGLQANGELVEAEDAAEAIASAAEAKRSDLVVVGRSGHRKLTKLLPGRVTSRLAHLAPCSVWIVR